MTYSIRPRFSTFSIVIACAVLLSSCGLSKQERRVIDAWLNCDECLEGERDSVRRLGSRAVGALSDALEGPPPDRRQIMRTKFAETYSSFTIAELTQTEYVNQLLSNYVATYQKRAATSLRDIAGADAREALDEAAAAAASRGYRDDVVRLINFAIATFDAVPYPGRIMPSLVSFGDTVTVNAPTGMPFTLDELANLDGSPFPGADVLVSRGVNQIRFIALGEAGLHSLAVTNMGSTTTAGIAPLTIGSVLDRTDRAAARCSDLNCERASAQSVSTVFLPHTTFLSFWRTPPRADTLDLFKIQAASAFPLTAQLEWPGGANLDLEWRRCVDFAPTGNTAGATDSRSEQTSVTIPAGECWFLAATMRAGGADRAFARLRLLSP